MNFRMSGTKRFALLATTVLAVTGFVVSVAQSQTERRLPVAEGRSALRVETAFAAPSRAVPIQTVTAFETEFTRGLNEAIRFGTANRLTQIVHTKVYKNFVDTTVWTHESASATQLSTAQLQELRTLINSRVDLALSNEQAGRAGLASLGTGVIDKSFFTGKILPASRTSLVGDPQQPLERSPIKAPVKLDPPH